MPAPDGPVCTLGGLSGNGAGSGPIFKGSRTKIYGRWRSWTSELDGEVGGGRPSTVLTLERSGVIFVTFKEVGTCSSTLAKSLERIQAVFDMHSQQRLSNIRGPFSRGVQPV